MSSVKHNWTMKRATDLISTLLNVKDMHFHQLQQLHDGATLVLCFLSPLQNRCWFEVGMSMASVWRLSNLDSLVVVIVDALFYIHNSV